MSTLMCCDDSPFCSCYAAIAVNAQQRYLEAKSNKNTEALEPAFNHLATLNMQQSPGCLIVEFQYTNWRGELDWRRVVPHAITYGDMGHWHDYAVGWALVGEDMRRVERRIFDLTKITGPIMIVNCPPDDESRKVLRVLDRQLSEVRQ